MAKVLFCWELGAGLGHLVPLVAAGRELENAGHEVAYAVRDLAHASALLDPVITRLFQAPFFLPSWQEPGFVPESYPDILRAIGYRNPDRLPGLIAGWRWIYADFQPEIIVYDHSPTAMLAARDLGIPGIGLSRPGFTLPPPVTPMPNLRTGSNHAEQVQRENDVTAVINRALDHFELPNIEAIADLFELDARILLSIPELDPYGPRDNVEYWGPLEHDFGMEPEWPEHPGKRIFVYVTRFDTLNALLEILDQARCPSLVHVSGMDAGECAERSTATLRLSPGLLDLNRVLDECDLVVMHGGSMTASVLLAGKPMLMLPLHFEHQLTAARVQALGAGLNAPQRRPQGMQQKLHRLLNEPGFSESAAAVAGKYRDGNLIRSRSNGRFAELVQRVIATPRI